MLRERSIQKELIDLGSDYYSEVEYIDCLKKLFKVNTLFGFYHSTEKALKRFKNNATVLEIGCGSGLSILNLSKQLPKMYFLGIDISNAAIKLAQAELAVQQQKLAVNNVVFQVQTSTDIPQENNSVDIVLSTLVCHHISDQDLIYFFKKSLAVAKHAVIINDLHRHILPYVIYRIISPILFRNRLITHDGLISIKRAFVRSDWERLFLAAGIKHYQIKWCFPFRWQVILWKK